MMFTENEKHPETIENKSDTTYIPVRTPFTKDKTREVLNTLTSTHKEINDLENSLVSNLKQKNFKEGNGDIMIQHIDVEFKQR
jgi:hypothetical protein